MPTRILRDWTDSQHVEDLTAEAERLFVRLIMKADDYGRYHADVRLVRAGCFPLLTTIRDTDISRWLAACDDAGLIVVYEVGGRSFLAIVEFRQRTRQQTAKFPPPDGQPADWLAPRGFKSSVNRQSIDRQSTDNGVSLIDSKAQSKTKAHSVTKTLPSIPESLQSPEFIAGWERWQKHRRQKRQTLTPLAAEQQLKNCESWGVVRSLAAFEHSIGNGYTGLIEPKESKASNGETPEQYAKRIIARENSNAAV